MAAGGEVLKFLGDGVMGIFRSDRPGSDIEMREQALAASTRAMQDISALNPPANRWRSALRCMSEM